MRTGNAVNRAAAVVIGGALLLTGLALLVLPGPGLLLVLAGLLLLSRQFPSVDRYVGPVRERALRGAEDSVSTPLKTAVSVLTGVVLMALGLLWGLRPGLPFGGWAAGAGLIVSGVAALAVLGWSLRRKRSAEAGRGPGGDARTGRGD